MIPLSSQISLTAIFFPPHPLSHTYIHVSSDICADGLEKKKKQACTCYQFIHGFNFDNAFTSHLMHAQLWVGCNVCLIMSATHDTQFTGWFTGEQFLLKSTRHCRMNGMKSKHKSVQGVALWGHSTLWDCAHSHNSKHTHNSHTHTQAYANTKAKDGCAVERTRLGRYIVVFTAVGLCST